MTSKKPRIIKKYPNRRLYDTTDSKYVTLARIRELLLEGEQIQVFDSISEEEITRQILMQIITEQENSDSPLFSTDLLAKLIRLYQGAVPGVFHEHMEKSFDMFLQQQSLYQQQVRSALGTDDPLKAFSELTQKNLETWREMQENALRIYGLGGREKDNTEDPDPKR
ncbi:MAG: polyhydroxyalkanoate synthesis repressor PhaR [Gammaproteobacteria bacterium]|nr:polyhydroxyalkanoate synthesis repressor PhaR [Gammaproteobacteria bacterium]